MNSLPVRLLMLALLTMSSAWSAPTSIPAAQVDAAALLRDRALHDDTAFNVVASLTTEIGPRLAGGDNDQRARDWAVAKFKALGFDTVWTEPVTYPKWVRRGQSAAIVSPHAQPLMVLALGGSPATPSGGLQADIVAFKDMTDFKKAVSGSVKGKIVYIGYRMHQARDGHDYSTATDGRTNGPALAAKWGAAAFLLRSAGSDNNRLPHTGVTQFAPGEVQIPAAALSNPDADLLERMLAAGGAVSVSLNLDCGVVGEYTGANVIAQLNGSEHPEQIVEMGGHLDSWDPGTGAIDDGAGVAITMAAGHLISTLPQRPRRSIRVIAFANEEAGMYGGKAYATAHAKEVAQHVLAAESDFGAGRVWRLRARVAPESAAAVAQIMQVLAPLGVSMDSSAAADGGDFDAMGQAGMALLGLTQDGTRYFDWHHTANDTLDKIDRDDLNQNVAAYAAWAYLAAQADGNFGSAPGAFQPVNKPH